MSRSVTLLEGEGIGPEVVAVARRVVEAATTTVLFEPQPIGAAALEAAGTPLPEETLESIRRNGVALKGPVGTPRDPGAYRSVNVAMREPLGLFAQLRPVLSWPGIGPVEGVDLVVAREITEDLAAGIEFERGAPSTRALLELVEASTGRRLDDSVAVSLKPISERAARRFFSFLFSWALEAGRRRVTVAHKATVQRATDGLFLEVAHELAPPSIELDDCLVDALAAELVRRPTRFDVIAAPALYGDILSDLAGALTGGLGLAPGVNMGADVAVFEAAHGTAPKLAGLGRANPAAMVLCASMLLEHLGERDSAARIRGALGAVLAGGDGLTYDLAPLRRCPVVSTEAFGELIVEQLRAAEPARTSTTPSWL